MALFHVVDVVVNDKFGCYQHPLTPTRVNAVCDTNQTFAKAQSATLCFCWSFPAVNPLNLTVFTAIRLDSFHCDTQFAVGLPNKKVSTGRLAENPFDKRSD